MVPESGSLLFGDSVVVAFEPGSVVDPSAVVVLLVISRVFPVFVALLLGELVVVAFKPGSVVGPSVIVA